MGIGTRHVRYKVDLKAHESSQTAHQVIIKSFNARVEMPHTVAAEGPLKYIDPLEFPFGITLVKITLTHKEDTAYTVVVEEWSDPTTHDNDLVTITTTGSEAFKAVLAAEMDDTVVASGAHIFLHLPNTVVDYLHFGFIYTVNTS